MKKILYTIFSILVFAIIILPTSTINAQATDPVTSPGDKGLLTGLSGDCLDSGDCTICQGYGVFIDIFNYILGMVGGITIFMFFIAGIYAMIGGVDQKYKTKAINVVKYAGIGLFMIFFAYAGVNLILNILLGTPVTGVAMILNQDWNALCK